MSDLPRVAVIGLGGLFPDAATPETLWRNILSRHDSSREPPPGRWILPPDQAVSPGEFRVDKVPHSRGCFLDPFTVDLTGLDLPDHLLDELDPVFHLAVEACSRAWKSARTVIRDPRRAGVILGAIALPTEKTSEATRFLLGRTLAERSGSSTLMDRMPARLPHPLNQQVTGLPAKLAARALRFEGPAFTLDAACASSLYAVKLAMDELQSGRVDLMLAGGLSRPDSLYTQMGFAQLRALSPSGRCSPFDVRGDGLMVGEGAGVFVLKRLEDASRDGDSILAVLAGCGLSNDVEGGLLAPASEGQLRAMRAAYALAGWSPDDVDLIECHATGTPIGDAVELQSLRTLWTDCPGEPGRCALGAVKSTVGHLLTGAGAAALTKVLFALREKTLPPTANHDSPLDAMEFGRSPFRIPSGPEPWRRPDNRPRRAAVSAFGFGGINAHLLVEEFDPSATRVSFPVKMSTPEPPVITVTAAEAVLASWSDASLLGLTEPPDKEAPRRWWGLPSADWLQQERGDVATPGYYLSGARLPADRFRIPPREVEEMLPQQVLMLDVAGRALDSANLSEAERLRTGVFLGVSLDPNTTNYHLRWAMLSLAPELADQASPALTANRTMGALASIAASRIARAFRLGGPSYTLSGMETSGVTALRVALSALNRGEIDVALVGAVDLAGDPRSVIGHDLRLSPCDGAVALVLRSNSTGWVRIQEILEADSAEGIENKILPFHLGAATGLAKLYRRLLSMREAVEDDCKPPQAWMGSFPRSRTITGMGGDGSWRGFLLEASAPTPPPRLRPRREALFIVEGKSSQHLLQGMKSLQQEVLKAVDAEITESARSWHRLSGALSWKGQAIAYVARTSKELLDAIDRASNHLTRSPDRPMPLELSRDRIFYSPQPLGESSQVALVFPGSGCDFPGMGRELALAWPEVIEKQRSESRNLEAQYLPQLFWTTNPTSATVQERLFAQVALATLCTDILRGPLGIRVDAAIGYSLGESSMLFGLRAWRDRDGMLQRMMQSSLFVSDLTGSCDAARQSWKLKSDDPVDWRTGIVERTPDEVRDAMKGLSRVYLQIINTPRECVIGGNRSSVDVLVRRLGCNLLPVAETTTMHCEVVRPVAESYRALHLLPTTPPEQVRFYSTGLGHAYDVDSDSAADAILAQALDTIDFPAEIEAAYAEGIRVFIEVGPGASCSRMIAAILGDRPHLARSICVAGNDGLGPVWRLAGHLAAERIPFSMEGLYPDWASQSSSQERWIEVPIGMEEFPKTVPVAPVSKIIEPAMPSVVSEPSVAKPHQVSQLPGYHPPPLLDTFAEQFQVQGQVVLADTEAHAAFLRYDQSLRRTVHDTIAFQGQLFDLLLSDPHADASLAVQPLPSTEPVPTATAHSVALDRNQCLEYAIGSIGKVLGPAYSAIDSFPTRVRLPDEPLMLVDRIVVIEGEPLSLSHGRVVTEHDVLSGAWYLDNGRIPTCLAVESGQADLFLSGYLGIDLYTHGLAVYRLLDAVVTFHRGLPTAGQTIRYDIHIDHFFRQGNTHLFRFRFEATVDGEILLTMTDGCAGFFGAEELAAGKGIIQTELQRRHIPGKEADDRAILPEMRNESFDESQVDCLRRGDLAGCFGPAFARLPLTSAVRLPGGKMRLVHRIERLEPRGGRFGLGLIRGEADIHPDDWFLTCHFVDDQVMPGTLMYECCLHTLRIFLMRLGWVGEQEEVAHEPVPGVASRLKCRGQVTASTRMVTYEVVLKQRDYAPDAFVIADALMYADGKPIVEITDMSLRLTGLTRERVHSIWQSQPSRPLFDRHHILAFATGKPSEAFGDRYLPFDDGKFLARLPAPPYSFLDRIVSLRGEPWQMVTGGSVDGEYDVPRGEWYFQSERSSVMPFAVLLEIPLQVCGWMSSYMGSALTNPGPLHYRNLGGDAELLRVVRDPVPETGTMLTSRIATTRVAASGGMIIQDFTFEVFDAEGTFYRGSTTFGFFSPQALAQQIGIREGAPYQMSEAEQSRARAFPFPADPPFPDRSLAMIDFVDAYLEDGGPAGLGVVRGFKMVNPEEWFFKAHFYQDPVMPGSLGLEAMLQLLKVAATLRWPGEVVQDFEANLGRHRWMYRGQVVPSNKRVVVQAEITHVDPVRRELTADGWLSVDGLVIYRMSDFRVRMVARPS